MCGAGSFYCDYCCIPMHEKCVHDSGQVKNVNFFVGMNV